ncbi:RNA polymerase sigma factor [Paracidovorax cattleyae]|uniref:RNA polymerase sigma-70 factor, ECF subfamily n=1 Tax=Paracidovorax cattleyae TaxID=80868 RepID=A0A1H0WKQ0_9BURK|nr:sigma-70 family RNA polymerase sigma factor [Paracidovorax cattleyae]AVS72880.1 RNA polymerase subunit sigma-24 [Paracidovorax cattleyae]SDP91269.1 RNA polymerase sigma-70 factor, ECF subfamily [Paracidovorax cattleyae]
MTSIAADSRAAPGAAPLLAALVQHYEELVGALRQRFGEDCFPREIVNEVCVRLLERPVPQHVENPVAFLRAVSRDLAIDRHRARARRPETAVEPDLLEAHASPPAPARLSPPELACAAQQCRQALLSAIAELPEACRDVFVMAKLYGLPQDEVAQRLGISRSMVARHLARALRSVQPVLQGARDRSSPPAGDPQRDHEY